MPGDHIDTRFQRLRYLRHDRFSRRILSPAPPRTVTEFVPPFLYFVSPFSSPLLPFPSPASRSPNPNSIYIGLLQGFVHAVNVNDVVSVGRLIAASVFGRRGSSLFSDLKVKDAGNPVISVLSSFFVWNETCTRQEESEVRNGRSSIHICKFAFCPDRHWLFCLGDLLLHLGWPGAVWFSEEQSRGQPHNGPVGILDAWLHAVPDRDLSTNRTDLVQRLRQSRSIIYGRPSLHCFRYSLVRDGLPAVSRFQRPARWLDGDSIPISLHSRR